MLKEKTKGSVKGLIFSGTREWILKQHGKRGLQDFLKELSPSERELWSSDKMPQVAWYPAELYLHLYEVCNRLWGEGRENTFIQGARYVAQKDFSSFIKLFLKIGSPSFVAGQLPSAWRHYFNTGLVNIIYKNANMLSFELVGAGVYGRAGCQGAIGWTTAVLEFAGAKNLIWDHPKCVDDGQPSCVINYHWQ